jgi:hypothetical protein
MNIEKLQSQLQRVPDNALIGYVQNPEGQVPSYLALAELARRKEIRKSAAPQEQAPTQSVAEQAVAEAGPGIAGIPMQDPTMFSEQSMAAGGIVAFAGPEGSLVQSGFDPYGTITASEYKALPTELQVAFEGKIQAPHGLDAIKLTDIKTGKTEIKRGPAASTKVATNPVPVASPQGGAGNVPLSDYEARRKEYFANYQGSYDTPNFMQEFDTPQKQKPVLPAAPTGGITTGLKNAFSDITVPDRVTLDRAEMVGEAPTLSGIRTSRKDAYTAENVNEDLYNTGLANIATQKEELKSKGKDEAIGEFLMNLGFGAAGGTSQNALTNFSQAAGPAGKGLIGNLSKLKDKEEKLNEREFAMMDAQNKFRQTGADADLRNLQEQTKDYRSAQREYAKTDAQLQDTHIGRKFSLETNKANEAGQNARAELSAKLQAQQINVSAFSADTQRMIANKPELFNTVLTNLEQSDVYKNADGVGKNKLITDAISDAKSTSAVNDSTLRTKALEITSNYFASGGAGAKAYKELLKTNPDAAKKMYNDYFNQQLGLAKSTLAAAPASSGDPLGIL